MRKLFLSGLISVLSIMIISCVSKQTSDKEDFFAVSGTIYIADGTAVEVEVSIDERSYWTTTTDADGNYTISDVTPGEHNLMASQEFADGSYILRSEDILVVSNETDTDLILPEPVILSDPDNLTHESMGLIWSVSSASDFREYKLYSHDTPGLDETTGTLEYVSISPTDTSFTLTGLNPLQTYYFRVFLMNDFGQLGGSNIVNATTANRNLIRNGDFEIPDTNPSVPSDWTILDSNPDGVIVYTDDFPSEGEVGNGEYCMLYDVSADGDAWEYWIRQVGLFADEMVPGGHYLISGWNRVNNLSGDINFLFNLHGSDLNMYSETLLPGSVDTWEQFSYEFVFPEGSTSYNLQIDFHLLKWTNAHLQLWLDNVVLERVE
jgi:hypothetical protein